MNISHQMLSQGHVRFQVIYNFLMGRLEHLSCLDPYPTNHQHYYISVTQGYICLYSGIMVVLFFLCLWVKSFRYMKKKGEPWLTR